MKNTPENKYKKIKDPIYGYISIDVEYIRNIIDTPVFQRLRRIMQTSYTPLYSSALHNRFVHSLGVYHLGTIVSKCLAKSLKDMVDEDVVEKLSHIYLLACLLHDVGHAPFSHTGEVFYKFYYEDKDEQCGAKELHNRLCSLIESERLKNDLPGESGSAAPHEIMSAIIGIKEFSHLIGDTEDQEFFARCITGYKYTSNEMLDHIRNCYIGMLNSKVIDVDRLDYLIRDAYTSGFETVNIDYNRLLNAITIEEYMDKPCLAYRKDAVSVIENVVYAHDAERKWIQNHPIVLYEAYIIKHILESIGKQVNKNKNRLFSESSLSVEGNKLKGNVVISLLCDDDIIYLSKNKYSDETSQELFDRNKRRHPVWKSEAEYKAYIDECLSESDHRLLTECMRSFIECETPEYPVPQVINDDTLKKCQDEYEEAVANSVGHTKAMRRKIAVCKYLKKYSEEHGFPFDYLVLPASMFSSDFSKDNLKKTLIKFEGKEPLELKLVCNILLSSEYDKEDSNMYYLYYRRSEESDDLSGEIGNIKEFCEGLMQASKVVEN